MPPESFLIWGAGGHGKVVYDLLHALGHRVVGWIDRDPQAFHTLQPLSDTTIRVGQEEFMELARTTGYPKGVTAVALGIGDNRARLEALTNLGALPVPSLVHPSAVVSPLASVGRGTVIFPVAVVNAGATIGDAVIINSGAIDPGCWVTNTAPKSYLRPSFTHSTKGLASSRFRPRTLCASSSTSALLKTVLTFLREQSLLAPPVSAAAAGSGRGQP